MLARGEKKLDRARHDVDWQRQVYKIDVRILRNVFKRQVVFEILARIQTGSALGGRFGSTAKPNKLYAAFSFQSLQRWNVSNTSKPTATHEDNTDRCRHEKPRRSEQGRDARLNIQHLRQAEEFKSPRVAIAPVGREWRVMI